MNVSSTEIDRLPEIARSIDNVGEAVCASVNRAQARWTRTNAPDPDERFFMAGFALGLVKAGRPDLLASYPVARDYAIEFGLLREDYTPVNS